MKVSVYKDIKKRMEHIIQVRYTNLDAEREDCQALMEMAQRENNIYAIAFAHTYLGDYYIAQNDTVNCGVHLQKAQLLCIENGYNDLLPQINNLFGICYEALSDEQTAMQYYLQALQSAREIGNRGTECILLNNIANSFELLEDYTTAKEYYLKACDLIETYSDQLSDLDYVKLRVWGNISEVCHNLGLLDEMKMYLEKCEKIDASINHIRQYILYRGWCGYYAGKGDTKRAIDCVHELLKACDSKDYADKYLVYEMLIDVCLTTIGMKEAEASKALLDRTLSMRREGEVDRKRQIQTLNTLYCETFGTKEERLKAYQEYYQFMAGLKKNNQETKSKGLKNILYLNEIRNTLASEKEILNEEAHLDELTRLCNRRYFNKLVSKASSDVETHLLGFIMIDVDFFKEYNDSYGHAKGDMALKAVAQTLAHNAPRGIIPSRYGGDEFICLCTNLSEEEIIQYIEAVRVDLKNQAIEHTASHCASTLTLSMGYSHKTWSRGLEKIKAEELLDGADQALYLSKNAGRNSFTCWEK